MNVLDTCRQIIDTESGRVLLYRDEVEAVLTAGDTISRRQAIETVGYYSLHIGDKLLFADRPLRELPSAQPEQQWILCSERLPDELEEVNVTWVNHKPEPYYDFVKDKPFTASAVYYKDDWYWYSSVCTDLLAECGKNEIDKIDDAIEITAWMPLPEPYRTERREE